jgi:hypothetical protein
MSTPSLPTYADEALARLSVSELIELLIRDEDRVPRNVIDECARRGEAMLEALRSRFSDETAWRRDVPVGWWWLRLHSAMIFGLMPTEAAAPALVAWLPRITDDGTSDLQEFLAGYWPALFRNKSDAVQGDLRALCGDRTLDWYTRATAADAAVFVGGRRGSDALEAELAWLALLAADVEEDWDFRFAVGHTLLAFPRDRYRSILEALALAEEYGKIEDAGEYTMSLEIEDVEDAYARREDEPKWLRWHDPWAFYSAAEIAARQLRWRDSPPHRGSEPGADRAANTPDPGNRSGHDNKRRGRTH